MATSSAPRQAGFGPIPVTVIVAILLVAVIGVVVHRRNNTMNSTRLLEVSNAPAQQPIAQSSQQRAESKQYERLTQYTNSKYGLSFYYPIGWRVEERDPKTSSLDPTHTELSLWLLDTTAKTRAETAVITITSQGLDATISPLDHHHREEKPGRNDEVSEFKQSLTLKGKRTAKFAFPQSLTANREMYYFEVGTRTYAVQTFYEETNLARMPDYMTKFDQLVESMKLP